MRATTPTHTNHRDLFYDIYKTLSNTSTYSINTKHTTYSTFIISTIIAVRFNHLVTLYVLCVL